MEIKEFIDFFKTLPKDEHFAQAVVNKIKKQKAVEAEFDAPFRVRKLSDEMNDYFPIFKTYVVVCDNEEQSYQAQKRLIDQGFIFLDSEDQVQILEKHFPFIVFDSHGCGMTELYNIKAGCTRIINKNEYFKEDLKISTKDFLKINFKNE